MLNDESSIGVRSESKLGDFTMSKYVKLMAEYCSTALWNEDGVNLSPEKVPVPYWLHKMIDEWQAQYDRESFENDNFDVKTFAKHGYALAVKMKQNLPADWKVFYYDEAEFAEAWANQCTIDRTFVKEITI